MILVMLSRLFLIIAWALLPKILLLVLVLVLVALIGHDVLTLKRQVAATPIWLIWHCVGVLTCETLKHITDQIARSWSVSTSANQESMTHKVWAD
jgi:hypothetical protein